MWEASGRAGGREGRQHSFTEAGGWIKNKDRARTNKHHRDDPVDFELLWRPCPVWLVVRRHWQSKEQSQRQRDEQKQLAGHQLLGLLVGWTTRKTAAAPAADRGVDATEGAGEACQAMTSGGGTPYPCRTSETEIQVLGRERVVNRLGCPRRGEGGWGDNGRR